MFLISLSTASLFTDEYEVRLLMWNASELKRRTNASLVSGGGGSASNQRSDRALLALFVLIEGDDERSWRLYSGHVMETDSALN